MSAAISSSGGGGGGGPPGGGGSGGGGGGGPCGACKFLRRKCVAGCIFAPYFDSDQGAAHFAAVHKVFGASNVSKLLTNIPACKRLDAVVTICFEAQARLKDPVYGCVSNIFALQQQVVNLQAELSYLQAHLATLDPQPPPPPPPHPAMTPIALSIADIPSGLASSFSGTYDLSSFIDPLANASWATQQQPMNLRLYGSSGQSSMHGGSSSGGNDGGGGGGDLHSLARDFVHRNGPPTSAPTMASNVSSSSPSLSK